MIKARALLLAKARLVLASLLRSILATTRSQGEEERIETNANLTIFLSNYLAQQETGIVFTVNHPKVAQMISYMGITEGLLLFGPCL